MVTEFDGESLVKLSSSSGPRFVYVNKVLRSHCVEYCGWRSAEMDTCTDVSHGTHDVVNLLGDNGCGESQQ